MTYEQAEKYFPVWILYQKVAVFVSPTLAEIQSAEEIGADILQIHGTLAQEIIKKQASDLAGSQYQIRNRIFGKGRTVLR